PDLDLVARRDRHGEPGGKEPPRPGSQLASLGAGNVEPGTALGGAAGERQPLAMRQPDDLDGQHGLGAQSTASTGIRGSPKASATPGYTTLPSTTLRP